MKKVLLLIISTLSVVNAASSYEKDFSLIKEVDVKEVRYLEEEADNFEIKYSTTDGDVIMKLLKKEIKKKTLGGTGYKIIDTKVYNDDNLEKSQLYTIEVKTNHNNVSKVEYRLEGNKWWYIKTDREKQLIFLEFDLETKKEFVKNNFYIKIQQGFYKILYKVNDKFKPIESKIGESVKVITRGADFRKNEYLIKVRK